jgi:hypothetical protein
MNHNQNGKQSEKKKEKKEEYWHIHVKAYQSKFRVHSVNGKTKYVAGRGSLTGTFLWPWSGLAVLPLSQLL